MEIITVPNTERTYRVGDFVFSVNRNGFLVELGSKASHPNGPMLIEKGTVMASTIIQDPTTKEFYLLSVVNGDPVLTLMEG
jgi:hypothetical protein